MIYCYRYYIEGRSGDYVVRFPDIPEAITGGQTKDECRDLARDCLIGALAGYIECDTAIPLPTDDAQGDHEIYLRPLEAAKVALWNAMREKGMTRVKLAETMGVDHKCVRRWLDLDHASRIQDINNALRLVFGKRLITGVMEAA